MKFPKKILFLLVLILYAALIGFLVNFHFLSDSFKHYNMDFIKISSKSTRNWLKEDVLSEVDIHFFDIKLKFSENHPLVIRYQNNSLDTLHPTEILYDKKQSKILFENNIELCFSKSLKDYPALEILLKFPKKKALYNYTLSYDIKTQSLKYADTVPILFIENGDYNYEMPAGNQFNSETHSIICSSEQNIIKKNKAVGDELFTHIDWIKNNISLSSLEDYNKIVQSYISKSFLQNSNFYPKINTETQTVHFPEDTLAFLSESYEKNLYFENLEMIYNHIVATMEKQIRTMNYGGISSHLGNMEYFLKENIIQNNHRILQIEKQIKEKNMELLSHPRLFNYLLNHGNISTIDEILSNIVIPYNPELKQLQATIDLLSLYHSILNDLPEKKEFFQNPKLWIESIIKKNVVITDNKLFLVNPKQMKTDNLLNIKAGSIFITEGKKTNNRFYTQLGQTLIHSVLQLQNSQGLIPKYYNIETLSADSDSLSWGYIYPFVKDPLLWPSEQSLYPWLNPGSYIFCLGKVMKVIQTDSLTLELSNPFKGTQYILIQGLPLIGELTINDETIEKTKWYQGSRQGWFFNKELQSLYIKIKSDSKDLILNLSYYSEEKESENEEKKDKS